MISGETMSIFEPIPRESHWDDDEEEDEEDDFPPSGPFDPRSIRIAGIAVSGLVLLGLIVSNTAEREPQPRPLLPSVQVDPGAAAVEQADATRAARRPTAAPTTPVDISDSDSIEPVDTEDAPRWQGRGDYDSDDKTSGRSKWEDKPGNGNGHRRD
jgi:hypothetical protein